MICNPTSYRRPLLVNKKKEFEGLLNPAGVDSFAKKAEEKRDDNLRKAISHSSKKNAISRSQEDLTDSVKEKEKGGKE